jgi:peptidoglycan/xylan/chitin deacetylase (PgdA/CDA1 family)
MRSFVPIACLSLVVLLALAAGAEEAPPDGPLRIAVTVDDLPWLGWIPADGRVGGTDRLLAALKSHDVPAVGLVTCSNRRQGEDLLQRWLDAGFELGNHSYSHPDLQKTDPEVWLGDVRQCDRELSGVLGERPRWFRYPYLHVGPDVAVRDRVEGVLTGELGYTIARVSVDNHEWKLAELYGRAGEAGDAALQRELGEAYVQHMVSAVRNFRGLARDKLGRDVAHTFLLHSNALASDHLGAVLTALEAEGASWITLEEAQADPVYAMPTRHVGKWGVSWLYRVEPLSEQRPWDDRTWDDLKERFGGRAQ